MTCTKTQYASYDLAMADVARFQKKSLRPITPTGAYLCSKCGFHHITSKPTKAYVKGLKRSNFELKTKVEELTKELNILKHEPLPKDERIKARKDERLNQLMESNAALRKNNNQIKTELVTALMERNAYKKELDELKKGNLR